MSNNGRDRPPGGGSPEWVRGRGHNVPPGARGRFVGAGPPHASAPGLAPGSSPGFGAGISVGAPWDVKPPSGKDFQFHGVISAATSGTTPAFVPGAFTIPADNVGVVRSVTFLVNDLLQTSRVFFSVTDNAAPIEGWSNILVLPRLANSVALIYGPEETYPAVEENREVRVRVAVTDAGTYQVAASLHGWFYPLELHEAYLSAAGRL